MEMCQWSSKNIIGVMNDGQAMTVSDVRKSTLFNEYFSKIGRTLSNNIDRRSHDSIHKFRTLKMSARTFFMNPFSADEVASTIRNLNEGKSPGFDKVGATLVKKCCATLSLILTKIFNGCVSLGIYPDGMKVARVVPILKSGCKKEFSNYRPISILPVLNKIFEKLIYVRLVSFLECQSFFYQQQ